MMFAGMAKFSTVDYPKHITATVFTPGCNFTCDYCQNHELINNRPELHIISEEEIIEFLKSRKKVLDGVCITGGEPSIWHKKILEFIKKIKEELGEEFLIKVDTNGSNPLFVTEILDYIDFIAIDFKAIDYSEFSNIEKETVLESINIVKEKAKDYEVRITMYPEYIKISDFDKYGELLRGVKKIALQQYNNKSIYRDKNIPPYKKDVLVTFTKILEKKGLIVEIR